MVRLICKILLSIGFAIFFSVGMHAQGEFVRKDSLKLGVIFRQDYRYIEPSYRNNKATLDSLAKRINEAKNDGTLQSIEIRAYASPEGGERYNDRLALARTQQLSQWITATCGIAETSIEQFSGGVGWNILRDFIESSDRYYRDKVLEILDNVPIWTPDANGNLYESRKRALLALEGGRVWQDMYERYYPDIRCGMTIIIKEKRVKTIEPVQTRLPETVQGGILSGLAIPDTSIVMEPLVQASSEKDERSVYFAAKTNMLQDAALIPNLGVEFHLGKGWSIYADWEYSWWKSDRTHWYWRSYGGDLGFRKYFGRKAETGLLRGHHLGLYGQIYTYDFEVGGMGIIGGQPAGTIFDRFNYGGGLEYGYSFKLARQLNLDLSLGLGYSGGQFHEYVPVDGCYVWKSTKNRHYWGPTKAEVSLVWLIGLDKFNHRKGGER